MIFLTFQQKPRHKKSQSRWINFRPDNLGNEFILLCFLYISTKELLALSYFLLKMPATISLLIVFRTVSIRGPYVAAPTEQRLVNESS